MDSNASSVSCYSPPKSFIIKKILTYLTISVFFFSGGVEYSVILPTCWDFMKNRFQSEKWLYGLTLAALSMSNLFVGPIMGAVYDRTHQTKALVLFLLLFTIGGNFMYFAATSKYMVLGSRFIVGVGLSAGAVLFGELARITSKKERTRVFSLFMSTRQIGLVIGPAFNLFLRICNFSIGPFIVDKYTAPALFMVIVFFLTGVLFLVLFFHLPPATDYPDVKKDEQCKEETDNPNHVGSPIFATTGNEIVVEVHRGTRAQFDYPSITDDSETSSLLSPTLVEGATCNSSDKNLPTSFPKVNYGSVNSPERKEKSFSDSQSFHLAVCNILVNMYRASLQLLREETVVLLIVVLFSMTAQLILETGLVPFVENMLDWKEIEISLFYSAAGAEIIFVFLITTLMSKWVTDRWLIVIGAVLELIAYVWYTGLLGDGRKSDSWILEKFIAGTFVGLFGLPFLIVGSSSLFSKLLRPEIQGFGQGIRRSMVSLACIFGPLWAGAAFELSDQYGYYPFFGVTILLMTIILILIPLSFSKLIVPKSTSNNDEESKHVQYKHQ